MRVLVPAIVLLLATSACSATPSSTESGAASPSGSSAASAAPTATALPSMVALPSAAASSVAGPGDWKLVSAGLERPGAQLSFDADVQGDTAVVSVLSEEIPGDYNAGLVYSTDGGSTWAWGGVVADAGRTFPEAVALVDGGAVIVGSTQTGDGAQLTSHAFMARAAAPSFAPEVVALPEAFDGDGVHLQDIVVAGKTWVIVGYTAGLDATTGMRKPVGALWRSKDQGATWERQDLSIEHLRELTLTQMAIAPDGSWNIVGQGGTGDAIEQYDPVWLRSTDKGKTFTREGMQGFVGDFDQGADSISFAADGSAAINGWDEMNDEHGTVVSALWISVPSHGLDRVGGPQITMAEGATPPGDFVDGAVWNGTTPVVWGSATGAYPGKAVQFWTVKGSELQRTTEMTQDGQPLAVDQIIPESERAWAFGFVGPIESADVAVWQGSLGAQ